MRPPPSTATARRRRPLVRRGGGAPSPGRCGSPSPSRTRRRARRRWTPSSAARCERDRGDCCARSGHEVVERDPDYGGLRRGRRPRATARDPRRRPRRCRTPSASTRRTRGWPGSAGRSRRLADRAGARGRGRRRAARLRRMLRRRTTSCSRPVQPTPPAADRRATRAAARCGRSTAPRAACPTRRPGTSPASPPPRCPPGFSADGFPLARPARRPARRRGDAALARRPARGRRGRGPTAARRVVVSDRRAARVAERRRARAPAPLLLERFDGPRREVRVEDARRPTSSPRPTSRPSGRSARCSPRARPDDAILGEEGGDAARHERPALGRRPARRHRQLPVRHPAVGASASPARTATARSPASSRPAARRAVRRRRATARGRRSTASRCDGARAATTSRPRWSATGFGYDAEVRARAGRGRRARCCPRVRDIRRLRQRRARPRVDRGGRYDAYYERGLSPGTSPRASCCARARASTCASCGRDGAAARRAPRRAAGARRSARRARRAVKQHVFRPTRRMFSLAWRLGAVPSSYSPGRGSLRK